MVIRNFRDIREQTRSTLNFTPWDIKKTVFVYSAITLGLGLLINILSILLESQQFGNTGLSGMATYRLFATAVSFLSMAYSVCSLFWQQGIRYSFLMVLRNEDPYPQGLFRGFKCWGMLLRFTLFFCAAFFAICWIAALTASMLVSPFISAMITVFEDAPVDDAFAFAEYIMALPNAQKLPILIPLLSAYGLILLVVSIFLLYRLRPIMLLLLDEPRMSILRAILLSFKMTKGSGFQLFRLDLSFWWYYLALVLSSATGYLVLLPACQGMWAQVLIEAARALLTLLVYMLGLAKINTANAVAYDIMSTPVENSNPHSFPYLNQEEYDG